MIRCGSRTWAQPGLPPGQYLNRPEGLEAHVRLLGQTKRECNNNLAYDPRIRIKERVGGVFQFVFVELRMTGNLKLCEK